MKNIRTLSSRNLTNEKLVGKINEVIRETNRQKQEIRQVKSKSGRRHSRV